MAKVEVIEENQDEPIGLDLQGIYELDFGIEEELKETQRIVNNALWN